MRVLILGARGLLGTDLLKEWQSDELIPATSAEADIRQFSEVETLVRKIRPDWIVNSAAYTDVDGCERNSELAFAVNCTGVENLIRAAHNAASRILHLSTDYVFSGQGTRPYEITDPVAPINVYGASKAAGEAALQRSSLPWCIVRTSWLFGVNGHSFPQKVLQAAETRPELSVVDDQLGSPTYTRDLARAIRDLVQKDARGIVHVSNEGACSWYEFAKEILARSNHHTVQVKPISTDQSTRPARRPNFSVLSPSSLHAFGIHMRPWQQALKSYLEEKSQLPNI
jgi:dTDP-4-dehydrorhamnose reductase